LGLSKKKDYSQEHYINEETLIEGIHSLLNSQVFKYQSRARFTTKALSKTFYTKEYSQKSSEKIENQM